MSLRQILILGLFLSSYKSDSADIFQTQIFEARQLYAYRAYKDVQIFQYAVPPQVNLATLLYKANGSSHCHPKEIAVYLQYGSYPVINPRNASFPDYFAVQRLFLHKITLYTDLVPVVLNITNPLPGNWYAAAFLIDNTERIAQKGLYTPCSGWLTSSVRYSITNNVKILLPESQNALQLLGTQMYRFYASENIWSSDIILQGCRHESFENCPVIIRARPQAFPLFENNTDAVMVNCSLLEECHLNFVPMVSSWNYISLQSLVPETLKLNMSMEVEVCQKQNVLDFQNIERMSSIILNFTNVLKENTELFETPAVINTAAQNITHVLREMNFTHGSTEMSPTSENSTCWPDIPLVRVSFPTNLAFEYNIISEEEEENVYSLIQNITNSGPTLTKFEVFPTVDIGGTLVIELAVSPFTNFNSSNVSVTGCLKYGIRPTEMEGSLCESGLLLLANTSSWKNRFSTVIVPFPEAGSWYISLLPSCYTSEGNGSNSSITVPCESSVTPVYLRIRSAPCILGQCGDYGTCYQYVSGGFIFSTCNCIAGWRGWGCTDNTTALTRTELLVDVLLLTLSNILFIPAVAVAIYEKYYTEAFVYFATMIFSTFYHACDAEVYSYCLIRLSVLQFCDFYSAILSVWVTLIAMADLPTAAQSFIHMAGAVAVALGVEYDRTGLWVFVLPAGIGMSIMTTAWIVRCCKKHSCYPKKKVWLFCLLPGILLASSGLIAYAFFETKDNYAYVHSAWHCAIALSVFFFLPRRHDTFKSTLDPVNNLACTRVLETDGDGSTNNAIFYEHLLTSRSHS